MKIDKKHILGGLNVAVAILFMSAFFVRCASIMTPDGGPKDTIPPVIVNMLPDNFSTNFSGKRIYIEFDEFVQLKDQQKEFFTSPQMKTKPKLTTKGRGVVVTLGDSLAPNTTYALNFGSSIQDNNEGNPLYSMRYVFSTGDHVDSMIMSGYAEDSYKSDSVSRALIYFFVADSLEYNADYDSTMFNYTPAVIARAENNGIFLAQNLKPVDYRVYAFEDRNDNFTYEPATDQIAFINSNYNPAKMPDFAIWLDSIRGYVVAEPQLHFSLFEDKEFARQSFKESSRPKEQQALLYFGAAYPEIVSIVFDSIPEDKFFVEPMTKGRDTLSIWFDMEPGTLPDTIRGELNYYKHDSIRNLTLESEKLRLTWRYIETKEQEREREKQERAKEKALAEGETWEEPEVENPFEIKVTTAGPINPLKPLEMSFAYPLTKIDTAAILLTHILYDSVITPQPITLERDTMNQRLWRINTPMTNHEGRYNLSINKGALQNIARQSNDSLSYDYTIYQAQEFSMVSVNFIKADSDEADYIIQLLNGSDGVLDSKIVSQSGTITFRYVPAGDIKFRIIQDTNKDGERSSGSLVDRLHPERVAYYAKDGVSTFQTKVNWDFSFDMSAEEMFAQESMTDLIKRLEREERQRIANKLIEQGKNLFNRMSGGVSQGDDHDHNHNH